MRGEFESRPFCAGATLSSGRVTLGKRAPSTLGK
jgi:hypothetical protein